MFHTVEKYKGPAQIILGLISLTFVGFGVSQSITPGSDYIVKVGEQKVSEHDLNQALQNTDGKTSRDAVFQSLLQRAYLTQGAKLMGIAVSQEQIKQIIVDDPNFHDGSGKFSQALLTQYLDQRRLSEDQFVEQIREQFAFQNVLNLVQNGTLISDAQATQLVKLTQSNRSIRSFTFSPEAFAQQVKMDDAAIQRYYDAHKKDYLIPQGVKIEYVALDLKTLAEKQVVSEAEVRKAFDESTAKAQPKREIAHIFFPVAQDAKDEVRNAAKAEAEKVLAEVKAHPKNFAALAKKYSKDSASAAKGGNLGFLAKDGGLGTEFENSAFFLQKGEISGVVQTQFGYHIITVLNIQDKPAFEQEKVQIEAQLKLKKASAEFNTAKEKLADEAFNNPNSLTEVAKKLGLKVNTPNEWLTKSNGEAAGMPKTLIDAVFSDDVVNKKHNSEPININDELVWVVRAKEVRQERTVPFAEIKDNVRMDYLRSEAAKLAEKKAEQSLADLKSGKKVDLKWSAVSQLTTEQARQAMPPEAYDVLMKAHPTQGKPAYVLLQGLPAPVLVEVQAITAPDNLTARLPSAKQALLQQQTANTFDNLLQYLNQQIKQEKGAQKINTAE